MHFPLVSLHNISLNSTQFFICIKSRQSHINLMKFLASRIKISHVIYSINIPTSRFSILLFLIVIMIVLIIIESKCDEFNFDYIDYARFMKK